ncbi:hypothetical protein P691DRAFT_802510 [Macrolepiota fuliginosa MF-IS2]|uniref:Uncharacterized protein n=1 Tax=Macrolepiota fuliginosa MF-IS2 TaxID=1400762 RepID=A0A9P6C3E7_9AGAR|nr:hypothetical protein P691DRAFT_802510 [Macrolepiota fuliginosa MF-IS2]
MKSSLISPCVFFFVALAVLVRQASAVPPEFQCSRDCWREETPCNDISHPVDDNGCWRCCLNDDAQYPSAPTRRME